MNSVASAHRGLAFLFLLIGIVAFFLAGTGAFGASFDAHRVSGTVLTALSLVLVILAAVGRREALVQSAVLLGLMLVQNVLAVVGDEVEIIGGLHPINGLLILFVAHQTARGLPLPFGPRGASGDRGVHTAV